MGMSVNERQRKVRERRKDKGLTEVRVWLGEKDVQHLDSLSAGGNIPRHAVVSHIVMMDRVRKVVF